MGTAVLLAYYANDICHILLLQVFYFAFQSGYG